MKNEKTSHDDDPCKYQQLLKTKHEIIDPKKKQHADKKVKVGIGQKKNNYEVMTMQQLLISQPFY